MVGRMNRKKDYKWLTLIFLVTLILLLKLFLNTRIYGHDTLFHAGNIINLSKTISFNNIFGSNLISFNTNPFGYGTWFFYPKLPHLLGAYIYLITKDFYLSMAFIYLITTCTSGIMIYYLSKKLFNNTKVSFLSSVIYLTFSYHICEIYTRDAYAENFIFLVIPMVFLGLYELKDNNYHKFYLLFILGYTIGMYSHLISMVFCTIFVALFLIYNHRYFLNKRKIKSLVISTIIVTCLTLPFLTNILQHKLLGDYVVFTEYFSSRKGTIFNIPLLKSYIEHDKNFIHNNILIYLNYSTTTLLILTTILFMLKKYKKKFFEKRKLLIYASLLLIMFINSNYLWEQIPEIFSTIQFPWRLMTFFCCIVSLYTPLCFIYKPKNKKIYNIIYILVVIIMILEGINNIYYYGNKEYTIKDIKETTGVMGWQMEYLPTETIEQSFWYYGDYILEKEYKFIIHNNNTNIEILKDEFPTIKFKVNNINEETEIEIPRIYYLGYNLYNKENKKVKIYKNHNGFIATKINKEGTYTLKYEGTIYNKISKLITLLPLIIIIILLLKKNKFIK